MAAPTKQTRGTPTGDPLRDGYQTLLAITDYLTLSVWEKTVQPFGIDGGDPVDATTMHSVTWRNPRPRNLKTGTDMALTAAYDPDVLDDIVALINVEKAMTIRHPDGRAWVFWGYVRSFTPTENSEGEQPEADIVITPTMWDPGSSLPAGPVGTAY